MHRALPWSSLRPPRKPTATDTSGLANHDTRPQVDGQPIRTRRPLHGTHVSMHRPPPCSDTLEGPKGISCARWPNHRRLAEDAVIPINLNVASTFGERSLFARLWNGSGPRWDRGHARSGGKSGRDNRLHTRNRHLRKSWWIFSGIPNGLSVIFSNGISLVSGIFQSVDTFPVDFYKEIPMDVHWNLPLKFHFCDFWCAIFCPDPGAPSSGF